MRTFILILMTCSLLPIAFAADRKAAKPKEPEALAPAVESGYSEPYDYRGIKLGMTLAEFRKASPAPKKRQLNDKYRLEDFPILPVCTGDDEAKDFGLGLRVTPRKGTVESGGIACVWGYFKDPKGIRRYGVAWVPLGDYATDDYRLDFIKKPGDPEPLLFRMEIRVPITAYPAVSVGLTDKFGNPAKDTVEVVQNKMGAKFDSSVRIWENRTSRIKLTQRYTEVDQGQLSYELKSHAAYADDLMVRYLHESSKM